MAGTEIEALRESGEPADPAAARWTAVADFQPQPILTRIVDLDPDANMAGYRSMPKTAIRSPWHAEGAHDPVLIEPDDRRPY